MHNQNSILSRIQTNMYELEVYKCSRPNCGPENISNIVAEVFCTIKGAVIVSNVDIIRLVWLHVIREDLVSCQPLEPWIKVLKFSVVHTKRMGTIDFRAIIIESTVILSAIHKVWWVFRGRSPPGSLVEFRGDLQIKHLSQVEPFMVRRTYKHKDIIGYAVSSDRPALCL